MGLRERAKDWCSVWQRRTPLLTNDLATAPAKVK